MQKLHNAFQPRSRGAFSFGEMTVPEDTQAITSLAEASQKKVWHARNMIMLEAVIAAFMDSDTPQDVATILREQADMLENFG